MSELSVHFEKNGHKIVGGDAHTKYLLLRHYGMQNAMYPRQAKYVYEMPICNTNELAKIVKTETFLKKDNHALLNGNECCNMLLQKEFSILS